MDLENIIMLQKPQYYRHNWSLRDQLLKSIDLNWPSSIPVPWLVMMGARGSVTKKVSFIGV